MPDYELEQQALAYQLQASQEGELVLAAHAQQQQRASSEGRGSAPGPSVDGSLPPEQPQGAMSFAHWQQQPGAAQRGGDAEQAGPAAEEGWRFALQRQQQASVLGQHLLHLRLGCKWPPRRGTLDALPGACLLPGCSAAAAVDMIIPSCSGINSTGHLGWPCLLPG